MIEIYTDGACNKDHVGCCGFVVIEDNKIFHEYKRVVIGTTNNRMELSAINDAMGWCINNDINEKIIIYSDSKYAIGCITEWAKNWECQQWPDTKLNLDLIKPAYEIYNSSKKRLVSPFFQIKWIRGHNGNKWNEYIDKFISQFNRKCKSVAPIKLNIVLPH